MRLMEQMQKKLSKFEESEKFNINQANMYNDMLIKFNSLQYKYNQLQRKVDDKEKNTDKDYEPIKDLSM